MTEGVIDIICDVLIPIFGSKVRVSHDLIIRFNSIQDY